MGSTRLPDKVMLPLSGKPLLLRMYERVAASGFAGTIVIATTSEKADDEIVKLCIENNIRYFRGDSEDLLDRHYKASIEYSPDVVVKIPSDCPLIDPGIIDRVLIFYIQNRNYDFVSNLHPASYPDGNDVEVMPIDALKISWQNATKKMEREHTTPYLWDNPDKFRIGNVIWESGKDYSMSHRFTIDYEEDYLFIKKVYDELYNDKIIFSLNDILNLLDKKPEIKKINEKYAGFIWYRNHLDELKTISDKQTKII
jgi:spore coat polysaccharide biosynthesis protein SpsF